MEWIDRLNSAIRYMEEHLTDEIDYEQLGRIACCSSWHFQRMFSYMAGIPLSEYIRRRKMSLAAVDLLSSDARIIDIALPPLSTGPSSPSTELLRLRSGKKGYLYALFRRLPLKLRSKEWKK